MRSSAARSPATPTSRTNLVYNVFGRGCAAALARGVRFELDDAAAGAGFTYRYEIDAGDSAFEHWREDGDDAARWGDATLAEGPTEHLLSRTWWTLRTHDVAFGPSLPPNTRFGLRLCLHIPADGYGLTPARLKKVVAGTVSAFQRHAAPAEAVTRIARRIHRSGIDVASALQDPARAVLGVAERPIGLTEADVQWNPDDTRLVAAEVEVRSTRRTAWLISGRAFAVHPRRA